METFQSGPASAPAAKRNVRAKKDQRLKELIAVLAAAWVFFASVPAATGNNECLGGFLETACSFTPGKSDGVVRIYSSESPNEKGNIESIAVFAYQSQDGICPIHFRTHSARFPGMMWVKPIDLDGDGRSEFVVGETDAGASHTNTLISILRISFGKKPSVKVTTEFRQFFEDLVESDVSFTAGAGEGTPTMRIGKKIFTMKDGLVMEDRPQ